MKCNRSFYNRDTCQVAQDLLGRYLIRMQDGRPLVIRITETEAYIGRIDKACHAYNYRRTARTETLFAPPGTAYIYLIYGMYHCLNFVTEPEEEPCAVLIRGGQARGNQKQLAWNRYAKGMDQLSPYQRKHFLDGPGKLCQALALTRAENGCSLLGDTLFVCDRLEDVGLATPPEDAAPRFHHRRPPGGDRLCRGGCGLSLALSNRPLNPLHTGYRKHCPPADRVVCQGAFLGCIRVCS